MSNSNMSNLTKMKSSPCPANGRQTVGDGAFYTDATPDVLAVCHMQGTGDMYYYSTTFSGGPGFFVSPTHALLTPRTNSGAFDAPKAKCPPDRGSLGCVTDSPASTYASLHSSSPTNSPTLSSSSDSSNSSVSSLSDVSSRNSSLYTNSREPSLVYPLTPPLTAADRNDQANIQSFFDHNNTQKEHEQFPRSSVLPQPIINKNASVAYAHNIATPPLTPDDSPFDESGPIKQRDHADALEFLTNLFPTQGVTALQFAKSVSIASPGMNASFDGVVLSLPGKPKTLYVDGKSAEIVSLRESIVALLDLADEHLGCEALVIALEKCSPSLSTLLHSLMYVGGTVVTKPPFQADPAYVLVGLEI